MPAKNLSRINEDGIYLHIYNKGIEQKAIFNDQEDYQVFLGYLKEYLSAPQDPESSKKVFEVKGRSFRGIPHQPKNYFNRLELVTYSLKPDHFHLVLHQANKGSVEKFIRSLCTRYSMYFNKKYHRSGSLFAGPYKSTEVKKGSDLSNLSRYLHHNTPISSYQEYLGSRQTDWVKPHHVLDDFPKGDYQAFVGKFNLEQHTKELGNKLILETDDHQLERKLPTSQPTAKTTQPKSKSNWGKFDFIVISTAVFLLLLTYGIGNVKLTEAKNAFANRQSAILGQIRSEPAPLPETIVLPTEEASSSADFNDPQEATVPAEIKIGAIQTEPDNIVNIRLFPTIEAPTVGQGQAGDFFELISQNPDWTEIKMNDGTTGFIATEFVMEISNENP